MIITSHLIFRNELFQFTIDITNRAIWMRSAIKCVINPIPRNVHKSYTWGPARVGNPITCGSNAITLSKMRLFYVSCKITIVFFTIMANYICEKFYSWERASCYKRLPKRFWHLKVLFFEMVKAQSLKKYINKYNFIP